MGSSFLRAKSGPLSRKSPGRIRIHWPDPRPRHCRNQIATLNHGIRKGAISSAVPINSTDTALVFQRRALVATVFRRHRVGLTPEALVRAPADKDVESTLQHHRPPPLLGPATQSWTPGSAVMQRALVVLRQSAHPMAASVGPDSGHYIGQQVLIDRFLCSRQCRVKVPLLNGPDRGGTAGALDEVLVGQKAHVGAMTLADLDDATATIQISSPEIVTDSSTVTTNHENRRPREAAAPAFPWPAGKRNT